MSKILTIEVDVVLAKGNDLLVATGLMKLGQPYYILDHKTGKLSGVYVIDRFHNYEELKQLQKQKRLYVPFVEVNSDISIKLQQTDLKTNVLKASA